MVMVESLPFDVGKLIELCLQNNVVRIALFGSAARGEAEKQSDIDLVEFSKRISLLRFAAWERQLSEALGRRVDLLTEAAISPYLREKIRRDLRVIYEP